MNVNYNHTHSFQPNPTASLSLREELTATEIAIREKRPGTVVSNEALDILRIGIDGTLYTQEATSLSLQGEEEVDPSLRTQSSKPISLIKRRKLVRIPGYSFMVYPDNIPDLPPIIYAIDMKEIVDDWMSLNCKATLVVNFTRIPLAHWAAIYRYHRPKVWNDIKGKWRSWRVSYTYVFVLNVSI